MNCWEFKKCGREANGIKARELGICPAYPFYGTECGHVTGTLCGGKIQGTFAVKLANCMLCDFFKSEHYNKSLKSIVQKACASSYSAFTTGKNNITQPLTHSFSQQNCTETLSSSPTLKERQLELELTYYKRKVNELTIQNEHLRKNNLTNSIERLLNGCINAPVTDGRFGTGRK